MIHVHDDTHPIIHAPRKWPNAVHTVVKEELDRMVKISVIIPIDGLTEWIFPISYSWKEPSALHVCLDPQDHNAAICKDHQRRLTVEEIIHGITHCHFIILGVHLGD